MQRRPARGAW